MKAICLALASLFALFGSSFVFASSFSIKGLHIGMAEGDLISQTGMTCSPNIEQGAAFDKTCATADKPKEAFLTFAGYPVRILGAQIEDGQAVAIVVHLVGSEHPALIASLEAKHGKGGSAPNPFASTVWESNGERLSVGSTRSGDQIVSLWSVAASDRMVELRSRAIQNDM